MPKRTGRKSAAQTPAPPSERISGSIKNPKGSASSEKSASAITLSQQIVASLKGKLKEFKQDNPKNKKVNINDLKAVYRRGAGAYSSSHRPTITGGKPNTRNAWAMARVNKFLKKASGEKVKKAYVQDDDLMAKGGLIAPNGKKSNLTPEQYKLVRTPEFKAWFGDWENDPDNASKVVDYNGEPLVVYHGTTDGRFTIFDKEKFGKRTDNINSIAFFFTPSTWYASAYSESANNLRIKEFEKIFGEKPKAITPRPFAEEKMCFLSIKNPKYVKTQTKEEILLAKKEKHDGIILFSKDLKNIFEVASFEPEQIKLADGSNTTFDGSNPDIRYEGGGEVNKLIKDGIVELKMYDTTNEHSKIYGFDAKKPLYIQSISVSKEYRLKGIGSKVIQHILDYAKKNGNDVIFGHINQKAEPSVDVIKSILVKSGIKTIEGNNDFYIIINESDKYAGGGKMGYKYDDLMEKGGYLVQDEENKLGVLSISKTHDYLRNKYKSYSKQKAQLKDLPSIFIRAGLPKVKKDGTFDVSKNGITGEKEIGVSVFNAKYSPNSDYIFVDLEGGWGSDINLAYRDSQFDGDEDYENYIRKMYLVDGNEVGYGSDGEPLLDNKTIKVIGIINPNKVVPPKSFLKEYMGGINVFFGGNQFEQYPRYEGGGLLAPNGKKSNLTPEQYKLVRTAEFKAWFGDWENDPENASKVVDENGEPLVMIHSSYSIITKFSDKKSKRGFYFGRYVGTPYAEGKFDKYYGKKKYNYSVFLSIRKPLDVFFYRDIQHLDEDNIRWYKKDVDGIIWQPNKNEVVAFYPNQIKLADGSNTTFDGSNPDIRYMAGGKTKKKSNEGGNCYYMAGQFTMGMFAPKKIDYIGTPYLVHAEVQGQGALSHIRYGHAWVEDDVMVYDFSNDRELIIPKVIYYRIGDIDVDNPKKYRKYTFAEARKKMVDTGTYGCWDIETDYAKGGITDDQRKETYKKWKSLVNMSKSELERFYNSEEGKEAGLSAQEARKQGINSGRESARWIMRMKDTPVKEWTPDMWRWANKQISFISRMSGNRGGLYDGKGNKTRKHLSLLIWGHNPKKK